MSLTGKPNPTPSGQSPTSAPGSESAPYGLNGKRDQWTFSTLLDVPGRAVNCCTTMRCESLFCGFNVPPLCQMPLWRDVVGAHLVRDIGLDGACGGHVGLTARLVPHA